VDLLKDVFKTTTTNYHYIILTLEVPKSGFLTRVNPNFPTRFLTIDII